MGKKSRKADESYQKFNKLYNKLLHWDKKPKRKKCHHDDSPAPTPLSIPPEWLSPTSLPQAVQDIPLDMT